MLRSLVALSGTLLGNTVEITHNVAHWGDEQTAKASRVRCVMSFPASTFRQ